MVRALVLLTFGSLVPCGTLGCAEARRPPTSPACATSATRARALPQPAHALATGCGAEPSTVYGQEPVVFRIQGSGSVPVQLELRDARGQIVQQDQTPVPGQWRPSTLSSGDFRLAVPRSGVSCWVTVNRELSRATEPAR